MEQSLGMNDIYAIFTLFGCVCFCSFDFVSGHRAQRWMGRSDLNTQTKPYSIKKEDASIIQQFLSRSRSRSEWRNVTHFVFYSIQTHHY